jgi:hypothetical protein
MNAGENIWLTDSDIVVCEVSSVPESFALKLVISSPIQLVAAAKTSRLLQNL